jgi:hypothetical protein
LSLFIQVTKSVKNTLADFGCDRVVVSKKIPNGRGQSIGCRWWLPFSGSSSERGALRMASKDFTKRGRNEKSWIRAGAFWVGTRASDHDQKYMKKLYWALKISEGSSEDHLRTRPNRSVFVSIFQPFASKRRINPMVVWRPV